jgi:hypothetical protein
MRPHKPSKLFFLELVKRLKRMRERRERLLLRYYMGMVRIYVIKLFSVVLAILLKVFSTLHKLD